jgi:hypothetical protein
MRSIKVIAGVVIALGLSATAAQARLEGQFREAFVRTAQDSCLRKQKSAAVNAQISENLLAAYCTCAAGYMADNANADQLVLANGDISRGTPPAWMTDLSKQATRYCITNIRDYVKSN